MRFLAIAIIVLAFPAFYAWLRQGRKQRLWAYMLVGLLPFTINAWNLDAAVIDWAGWPGYAKGLVITLLDALALAIIATHRPPGRTTPMLGWMALYLAAVLISVPISAQPQPSAFYAFQILRMITLAVAVARFAHDAQAIRRLAWGFALGLTYQAGVAVWQKAGGALQAAGTMGHQNLLGMMVYLALLPLLAILLAGERSKLVMLGVLSAFIAVALGASRGSVLFAGIGLALLFVLSLARRATPHKWRMVGFAVAVLALTAPVAYTSLSVRFERQAVAAGAGEERAAFERAAQAMWSDHPFGVGANMYIIVANTRGYSDRAGVNWSSGRSTNVHNAYLLVAAETGWLGLAAFVALLLGGITVALRFAFADRRDPAGEIALGCGVGMIAVAGHNFYEWVFVMYQAQYMFAICLGIVAALARERRRSRTRTLQQRRDHVMPRTQPSFRAASPRTGERRRADVLG